MAAAAGAAIPLIEGLFATTAATAGTAAAAGTAAEAGGLAAAGLTVTGTAAGAGVGTAAAAGAGVAAGAGTAAALSGGGGGATQTPQSSSVMRTVAEASTVAATASSLYMLAAGPGRVQIPPTPMTGQGQIDQQTQQAEQDALRRRATAGGLQSTIGTGAGQAGAVLNPATLSQRSLLGG